MRSTFIVLFAAALASLFTSPLGAQAWEDYDYENLEFRGVSLELGMVRPVRVDPTLSLGLRLDLGYLGPHVRIIPGIAFWSSHMRTGEITRLAGQIQEICVRQHGIGQCPWLDLGDIRLSNLMVNLDGVWEFETPLIPVPYLGAGGGIHLLNGRGEAIDGTFVEDFLDAITPGVNLIAGLRIPIVDALEVTTEARYVFVSDVRHAAFTVGGVWTLPTRAPGAPVMRRGQR